MNDHATESMNLAKDETQPKIVPSKMGVRSRYPYCQNDARVSLAHIDQFRKRLPGKDPLIVAETTRFLYREEQVSRFYSFFQEIVMF
jgi:hypothetical protein